MFNTSIQKFLFICLCWPCYAFADRPVSTDTDALETSYPQYTLNIECLAITPLDDLFLGARVGGYSSQSKLGFMGVFRVRPYARKTRVQANDNLYYQYREERLLFGLAAMRTLFSFSGIDVDLTVGVAASLGDYRGTRRRAPHYATPLIGISVVRPDQELISRFGYQYMNHDGTPSHNLVVGVGFRK